MVIKKVLAARRHWAGERFRGSRTLKRFQRRTTFCLALSGGYRDKPRHLATISDQDDFIARLNLADELRQLRTGFA